MNNHKRSSYLAWKATRYDLRPPKFQNFPWGGHAPRPPRRACFAC